MNNSTESSSSLQDGLHDENQHDAEIVRFTENDSENPRNWSSLKKWSILLPIILIDLSVSFGASCYSPVSKKFMKDMHVSEEVSILGLSLFVLGLAFGPMTLAPLSEVNTILFQPLPYSIDMLCCYFFETKRLDKRWISQDFYSHVWTVQSDMY